MPEEWNILSGTVDAVVYQNEENGYTVLRLDVGEEDLVTLVGCVPGVAPGESLTARRRILIWSRNASPMDCARFCVIPLIRVNCSGVFSSTSRG